MQSLLDVANVMWRMSQSGPLGSVGRQQRIPVSFAPCSGDGAKNTVPSHAKYFPYSQASYPRKADSSPNQNMGMLRHKEGSDLLKLSQLVSGRAGNTTQEFHLLVLGVELL